MRSAFAADAASIWPDQFAPSADDAASPGTAGHADTAPPTRAVEADTTPAADASTPTASPAVAPAPKAEPVSTLTLTQTELDARIADATKRARADQSAMARQNKEMAQRLEARERAFGELVEQYRGTQVEGDALRSWMQSENASQDRIAEETRTAQAQTTAANELAGRKAAAATTLYQEQYGPLLHEAGQLGVSQTKLLSLIDGVLQSETFAPFHRAFARAQSEDDARDVAAPGYVLMAERVRAQLQQEKLDSLKEPESPPKPERTQAHGTGTGVPIDPLDKLPIGERGKARLRGGLMDDAMRLYQMET